MISASTKMSLAPNKNWNEPREIKGEDRHSDSTSPWESPKSLSSTEFANIPSIIDLPGSDVEFDDDSEGSKFDFLDKTIISRQDMEPNYLTHNIHQEVQPPNLLPENSNLLEQDSLNELLIDRPVSPNSEGSEGSKLDFLDKTIISRQDMEPNYIDHNIHQEVQPPNLLPEDSNLLQQDSLNGLLINCPVSPDSEESEGSKLDFLDKTIISRQDMEPNYIDHNIHQEVQPPNLLPENSNLLQQDSLNGLLIDHPVSQDSEESEGSKLDFLDKTIISRQDMEPNYIDHNIHQEVQPPNLLPEDSNLLQQDSLNGLLIDRPVSPDSEESEGSKFDFLDKTITSGQDMEPNIQNEVQPPNLLPEDYNLLEQDSLNELLIACPMSPDSEGFPRSPEWEEKGGYSVNFEESIMDELEETLADTYKNRHDKNKKKKHKAAKTTNFKVEKTISKKEKKMNCYGKKKRPKSSAFQIAAIT